MPQLKAASRICPDYAPFLATDPATIVDVCGDAQPGVAQSVPPSGQRDGTGHDDKVPYAEVIVSSSAIDPSSWRYWTVKPKDVVHHYTAGSCPVCRGRAEGHLAAATAPIETATITRAAKPVSGQPPIEILVTCNCGYGHGHEEATGCGRRWTIIWPQG